MYVDSWQYALIEKVIAIQNRLLWDYFSIGIWHTRFFFCLFQIPIVGYLYKDIALSKEEIVGIFDLVAVVFVSAFDDIILWKSCIKLPGVDSRVKH